MVIQTAFSVHTINPKVPSDQNGVVLELLDSKQNEVRIFIPAELFDGLKATINDARDVLGARDRPTQH